MDAIKSPADASDLVRFHRALFEFDLRNSEDPHLLHYHGLDRLKEQLHAELVTNWIWKLEPAPSEALLLAARAHHLRRWMMPREEFPTGRAGYHQWRLALKEFHAREAAAILEREGYPTDLVARVQEIIVRHGIKTDPAQQVLEDAICLTFLETQLAPVAGKLNETKMVEILRKTMAKMSPAALEHVRRLHIPHDIRLLMHRAVESR